MSIQFLDGLTLANGEFNEIRTLVKTLSGIHIRDEKKELVKARLSKRLRKLEMTGFREYLNYLRHDKDGGEVFAMLDAITTNQTQFFRETSMWRYLAKTVLPRVAETRSGRLRIWSAGCSSGEEPYGIAITVCESRARADLRNAKILATDISTQSLVRAREGLYQPSNLEGVPPKLRNRYFRRVETASGRAYRVTEEVRRLVHFGWHNLMAEWPMHGPFDVIFCCNVMIYFDKPTQQKLVNRFYELLAAGGTLFIGHSESLAGVTHRFRYVQPTIYERPR